MTPDQLARDMDRAAWADLQRSWRLGMEATGYLIIGTGILLAAAIVGAVVEMVG